MPFKGPELKRGQKRRIVLEFRGPKKGPQLKRLAKAVRALVRKHSLKLKKGR